MFLFFNFFKRGLIVRGSDMRGDFLEVFKFFSREDGGCGVVGGVF